MHAVFLTDLAILIKIVFDMIAFRNQYLVKSVSLAFTHVLFRSVYHDVAPSPSNVKVNGSELLASFFNAGAD